jgi:hypothetical protein
MEHNILSKSKTLGLALAVLLAAAAIAAWVLLAQFGPAIKSVIETNGALATQTQVLVGSVEFSPFTGAGAVDGLTVGNPAGFSSPYAVVVDRIALQAESGSLLGGGPVIIDSATVIAPQITYEAQSSAATSNLEAIKNNAQAYAVTPAAIQTNSSARKIIIRNLTIMGGSITINLPLPGGALTVPLPPLNLTNIGADTNGATPPEIIRIVCEAVADEAKKAVTAAITQKVKSVLDTLRPPAGMLPKSLPHLPAPPSMPTPPSLPSPPSPPNLPSPPDLPSQPSDMILPPPPPGF